VQSLRNPFETQAPEIRAGLAVQNIRAERLACSANVRFRRATSAVQYEIAHPAGEFPIEGLGFIEGEVRLGRIMRYIWIASIASRPLGWRVEKARSDHHLNDKAGLMLIDDRNLPDRRP
jgi:hypothetical protein